MSQPKNTVSLPCLIVIVGQKWSFAVPKACYVCKCSCSFPQDVFEQLGDSVAPRVRSDDDARWPPAGVGAETNGNADWQGDECYSSVTVSRVRDVDERCIAAVQLRGLLRQIVEAPNESICRPPQEDSGEAVENGAGGAVLVFLPGRATIDAVTRILRYDRRLDDCDIVPLHSDSSSVDQRRAFGFPAEGKTKVVLATSVAETSVTIPDITYVVDTGLCRIPRAATGAEAGAAVTATGLDTVWATRSSVEQRRGRAGRVRPGVCFRLFTRRRYEALPEEQSPELTRCPLHQLVLQARPPT